MLRKAFIIAATLGVALAAQPALAATTAAEPKDVHWSFDNPITGRFDQRQLQRGYKVYHDVCSACHAMHLMSYRNLGQPGGPFYDPKYPNPNDNPKVKAVAADFQANDVDTDTGDAIKRPATPADAFVSPFPNEYAARAANGGGLPPDLSLIIKAREGGPRYVYSILTGYPDDPPAGLNVPTGRYYNPYMPGDLTANWTGSGPMPIGGVLAMPKQLVDDRVTYDDGTKATASQEAMDVVAFLTWAAEPHADERKSSGLAVLGFLLIFSILLYASYRQLWKDIDHHS